jgi:hypothetical protein
MISTDVVTVTLAVASVTFGAVARITLEPAATPVTGTTTLVALAGIVKAPAETVAAAVLLEVTVKVRPPAGAGPERVSVRFWVWVPLMFSVWGEKLMVAVTCTGCVAEV